MPRAHLTEAGTLRGLRAFDGPFPAAGGHGGWGGPRWLSTESTASVPERPGSEPGAGPGLEYPSGSESDSESSEAREAAAAAAGEFDRAERRSEVAAEWEARGLVRR